MRIVCHSPQSVHDRENPIPQGAQLKPIKTISYWTDISYDISTSERDKQKDKMNAQVIGIYGATLRVEYISCAHIIIAVLAVYTTFSFLGFVI